MVSYVQLLSYTVIMYQVFQDVDAVRFQRKFTSGGITFKKKFSSQSNLSFDSGSKSLTPNGYEVDILMVADYSLYSGFVEMLNGDEYSAQFAVRNYLGAIFEQVRIMYENNAVFGSEIISLNLAALFVVLREEDCPLMPHSNTSDNDTSDSEFNSDNSTRMHLAINALDAVHLTHQWIAQYSEWLPPHDHAIVLTKFDLLSTKGDSSTQGMAYVGAMCRKGESTSVVEDVGAMATAMIAAHELAHSLGALHDGSGDSSRCSGSLNYMMAPMVSGSDDNEKFGHSFKLSSCSLKQIESFLRNETSSCIKRHRGGEKRLRRTSISEGRTKPGEMILQQHQCKITFGPTHGVCKLKAYQMKKDPCRRLWCTNRSSKRLMTCETKNYLPMFDGTTCGFNKWCIAGNCVKNYKEDNSCVDMNALMCTSLSIAKRKRLCESNKFSAICCLTCSTIRKTAKNATRRRD